MSSSKNRVVITGAPCSGKTTLVNTLGERGYSTCSEAALTLIQEEAAGNNSVFPWTNPEEFQKRVFALQLTNEASTKQYCSLLFLDRSLLDVVAYCRFYDVAIPARSWRSWIPQRYDSAFYLELLPQECRASDVHRVTTYDQSVRIGEEILKVYVSCLSEVHVVPVMPVSERVSYVLDRVPSLKPEKRTSV